MQELWPTPTTDLDIEARLREDPRSKPEGRPWVCLVMITSLDGGISIDGVSGGLGAPADQRRFIAARRIADGIVVGARTAATEDYRPTSCPIAVVTGSLSPDPAARLFGDPDNRPLLLTTSQAASTRGAAFAGVAEIVDLGESVEAADVLANLDERGMRVVVLEGGPTLNGQFIEADVVDEILLSISPVVIGGSGPGLARAASLGLERRFTLDRLSEGDGIVFARYLRAR